MRRVVVLLFIAVVAASAAAESPLLGTWLLFYKTQPLGLVLIFEEARYAVIGRISYDRLGLGYVRMSEDEGWHDYDPAAVSRDGPLLSMDMTLKSSELTLFGPDPTQAPSIGVRTLFVFFRGTKTIAGQMSQLVMEPTPPR